MNFYEILENLICESDPEQKLYRFRMFYRQYKNGDIRREDCSEIISFTKPSYHTFCQIVKPQKVPKRKNIAKKEGQVLLLHAVAHIEYSAIDLALDHLYRFRTLPDEYYDDWMQVALDEVRHFEMISGLMKELDAAYGDIEVHNALFEASVWTQNSFLERMAVVPRYLEANGLDATPHILEKLSRVPQTAMSEKIQSLLSTILEEEVSHVQYGDKWFDYACKKENVDKSVFFEIIQKYYPQAYPRKRYINVPARKEAGFSCNELNQMTIDPVC